MVSSVPKPPQRIRVEMPAEITPQPVPETLLAVQSAAEQTTIAVEKPINSKVHVIHPKRVEEEQVPPPAEQLETEAALAVSADPVTAEDEAVSANKELPSADEKIDLGVAEQPSIPEAETGRPEVEITTGSAPLTAVSVPPDEELFQKQYYTIGEVADMFSANQSQIRFWENEFEILQPRKNKKGDRFFRPEDIKNLVLIRHLLQERRFTIEGAKEYLKGKAKRLADRHDTIQRLEKLKGFLLEMKANLE